LDKFQWFISPFRAKTILSECINLESEIIIINNVVVKNRELIDFKAVAEVLIWRVLGGSWGVRTVNFQSIAHSRILGCVRKAIQLSE